MDGRVQFPLSSDIIHKLVFMELGILKGISPRNLWVNEERDFTPWLADHIAELGTALHLEMEVERAEVTVGPYSADILGKNVATGQFVVVENQLEKTNHDHLGKAITYASVLDASDVIWIATEFTPAHLRALNWLNDLSEGMVNFYGVQLELWQIDGSKPAVKFTVVCRPDELGQEARDKAEDKYTGSKRFQLEFWTKVSDKLLATKALYSVQKPKGQYWYDVALGRAHVHLSLTCNTDQSKVGVRVYMSNKIVDGLLPYLEARKGEIEAEIGEVLDWNPYPDRRDKIIVLHHLTDFGDTTRTIEAQDWLVRKTLLFRNVFSKYVKNYPGRSIPEE